MNINSIPQYQPTFNRNPKNFLLKNKVQIVSMLESGASVKDVATRFNTDVQAIYRFLRISNINPPQKQKKEHSSIVNNILFANIRLFIDKNLSIEAISKMTECTVKEINAWLTDNENKVKSLLRLEMFKSGMSPKEVAKSCGITLERALQVKRGFQGENLLASGEHEKMVADIQNDIRAGVSTKEIAKKYKLSESSIYRYKRKGGITEEDIYPVRKFQMISMIREGLGIREMARQLDVSEEIIKRAVRKYDLKDMMRDVRDKIEDMILEDSQNGVFLETLAHKYGYSKRAISYKINRAKERLEKKNISNQ